MESPINFARGINARDEIINKIRWSAALANSSATAIGAKIRRKYIAEDFDNLIILSKNDVHLFYNI